MIFAWLTLFALGLDWYLGDPQSRFHPVAIFGHCAASVERFCRKNLGSTLFSGLVGHVFLVGGVSIIAWAAVKTVSLIGFWAEFALGAVIIYATIALRSLIDHAKALERALAQKNLPLARQKLSMMVSRDTATLDESEIVRGALESLGENLTDAVTGVLFYAALGYYLDGVAGAVALSVWLRAVNTLDACWGYKSERYIRFGKFAARADDVLLFVPARITLLAIALAALLLGMNAKGALLSGIRHRHDHPSPNSCFGMASFAGALGIQLGGATMYNGVREIYPHWGNGRKKLRSSDLIRAERLTVVSALLFALIVVLLEVFCR
ncbi:MAG: adenosylcobinamide-phosphate synthase CbiB [Victivallales bacterium]|jgi:adenosylcobinamide-phosphate synthase|nr:adenosylcobinamide-phosphate synthase CbiB [Victivallales bacterium]